MTKNSKQRELEYTLDLARLKITSMILDLDWCAAHLIDQEARLRLYKAYSHWDQMVAAMLLSTEGKYIELYNDWKLIETYFPVSFPFEKATQLADVHEGVQVVRKNLEFLRQILKTKKQVLDKFEKEFIGKPPVETTIKISENGLIENLANRKYHQYDKADKRFKLIKYLAERDERVRGSTLMKKIGYSSLPLLSKEKGIINDLFADKLKIRSFITKHGYRINPSYKVIFG